MNTASLIVETKDKTVVKSLKNLLERSSQGNTLIKPIVSTDTVDSEGNVIKAFQLKTSMQDQKQLMELLHDYQSCVTIRESDSFEVIAPKNNSTSQSGSPITVIEYVKHFLNKQGKYTPEFIEDVVANHCSNKYSLYSPMILFNFSPLKQMFYSDVWTQDIFYSEDVKTEFFRELIPTVFGQNATYTHIAVNNPIQEENNIWRKPLNIIPLYGDFKTGEINFDNPRETDFKNALWCSTVQNGIFQQWAPIYTMFSRGNIKEKARILAPAQKESSQDTKPGYYHDILENDVLDMYCGIGYFTLSYMKRGCRNLFGFELNPWSCEGLKRGLSDKKARKFPGKCHVFNESNECAMQRLLDYESIQTSGPLRIRHINMGLLPTSEAGWAIALDVAHSFHGSCSTTTMHVHENLLIGPLSDGTYVNNKLLPSLRKHIQEKNYSDIKSISVTHVEKIKTFAPDVWHVCIDVDILFSD